MKTILFFVILMLVFTAANVYAQPNIFDPNDPIVNYDHNNPPKIPKTDTMAKWVRTDTRINWNTSKFKCYFWNGMAFRLRFPNGYNAADPTKKYPVILFFHGAGEIKPIYDNEDQLFWGAQPFEAKINAGQFDAFMLFPQVSLNAWDYTYYTRINDVLDSLQKYCHSDPDKLISMGLSNGGFAAMNYAVAFPQRVSTVIASSPALIQLIQGTQDGTIHIPHWLASGGLDTSPGPDVMDNFVDAFTAKGGDIRYNFYPTLGHNTWESQWAEPYLVPYWNTAHTANPLIFNKQSQFCPNTVTARLGISAGFAEYQWQVNNVDIPNSNSNEIIGTQLGTYRVRFRRFNSTTFSDWSLVPAVITALPAIASPLIKTTGVRSVVLPAPDGSTTVPLELPVGYSYYEWRRVSDNALVSTSRTFIAPIGQYKAKAYNCNANYSPNFNVISAAGSPKPDSARNLTLTRITSTSIKLNWLDVTSPVSNETGFEIYRAATAGGPYTLAAITAADIRTYTDTSLSNNYNFYYRIRAVNGNGAAGLSNESTLQPPSDVIAPTVPTNLKVIFTSRNFIDLEWVNATDNVGVTSYDVYVNNGNVPSYTSPVPSVSASGLIPNTSYSFKIVARDQAGNSSPVSNSVSATSILNGLKYHYYEGNWDLLPNFNTLTSVASGPTPNVDIAVRPAGVNDYFGFVWEGFINIRTPGTYTFETVSDDGSKLYFNSFYSPTAVALVNSDGLHGAIPATGTINIPDTGLHPIAITFFEKNSGESMLVYWSGPGIARQLIPNSAFTQTFVPTDNVPPSAPANLRSAFISRNYIDLDWDDATDNVAVTGYDIYVNNVFKGNSPVSSFTVNNLVPNQSYMFTVKARDFAGNTSAFSNVLTVTAAATALKYRYYEGNWDVLPNFDNLIPVKTGSSANTDITVRPPAVNDTFGFVWEGYINIKTPGNYTFETVSDDGSKFYFNTFYTPSATALVNSDGLHGAVSATGTVNVTDTGLYPIAITYFEKFSGQSMQVYWSGPGLSRQLIPNAAFTQAYQSPNDNTPPGAPTGLKTVFIGNTSVDLSWTASTDNVGILAYDVYVNNQLNTTSATTNATADNLTPNTNYSITVKARDLAGNTSGVSNTVSVKTTVTSGGLKYKFYQGSWALLPDFTSLTPVKTGTSTNIDLTVRKAGVDDNFGFVWEGYINIPTAGNYTFETVSDDGSKFYFNTLYVPTAKALVNNDGLHAATSQTGTVNIPTPGYYPISITFFEKDGGESMQVFWSSSTITRQLIPNSVLVSQLPADNVAPSTPTNIQAIFKNSTYINLTWNNSTDNVGIAAYDIYISGALKYTSPTASVTADGLTPGQPYTFTIKARDFAGNTSNFSAPFTASTTSSASGLTYKYYEGNWDLLPNFNSLTPLKTGLTPNVDIISVRNVRDNYGILWEGNINLPADGTYTFETISDDGSKLYFNSLYSPVATALVNNDGLHGLSSITGTVTTTAGIHQIAITFFQKYSGDSMQVYWSGPGIPRQLIPNAAFTGSFQLPPDTQAPSAPTNLKAVLTTSTSIDITWTNSTDNIGVTGYDVYVNNVKKPTVTTNYYSITGLTPNQPYTFTIKALDLATNASAFSAPLAINSTPKAYGLRYRYYEGSWNTLPNFNLLTPVKIGSSTTPDITVRDIDDNFGFVWEGYINITTAGTYTFETISDDGSKFYWNTLYSPTATALVNNDGLHAPGSATGSVTVAVGLYPITITYFERDGGETMQVYYSGPSISRQPIPGTSFGLTAGAPDQAQTTVTDASIALTNLNGTAVDPTNINASITSAYPNPFRDNLKIQYSNAIAATGVTVGVYDMVGRLVQNQYFGNISAGVSTLSINLNSKIMPGMYLVRLSANGKPLKMWKMVKQGQ